ncbi:MFS transporter [Ferruginivarius sediminum]|nr:MFS transporter [Ferruginivarius sediminum]
MDESITLSPAKLIPAGLAIVASTYGLARYTYGLFVPEIQSEFGLSTELMGLIASGSYAGYLAATLIGSSISGIVGPRLPIVLGGLAATIGMTIMAASKDPWLFALGVILAGTSPGLAYPPLSDAVTELVRKRHQNRTYAIINSGTSLGVIIAGPAALLATGDWRWAWVGFAVFAAVATLWNAKLLPSGKSPARAAAEMPELKWAWFFSPHSSRLFLSAFLFGIVTAVYWTFAVDLLVDYGTLAHNQSRFFWILIGGFGLLGGAAGDLVTRFGLRRTFRIGMLAIALAISTPALLPEHVLAVYASAMAFGSTFILITGLFGIWSVHAFHDRPSAGFGATFFLISAGQLVGPSLAGFLASWSEMAMVFQLAAIACAAPLLLGPRHDLYSMTPDAAATSVDDANPEITAEQAYQDAGV